MDENQRAVVPAPKATVEMSTRGVQLTSMDDAWRFCEAIAGTPIAPKGMDAKSIFGVIQSGAELGLSPLRSLANMKIINGRVGPMGALAMALVRQAKVLEAGSGIKQMFTGTELEDDWTAHVTTLRVGESEVRTTSFSVKDAKQAGLWMKKERSGADSVWMKYPKRMLMWRAVGFHMDDHFSDVMMGFHIAEALQDYPEERVVATMEPVEVPVKDALLDQAEERANGQAGIKRDEELEAELQEVSDQLQPPAVEHVPAEEPLAEGLAHMAEGGELTVLGPIGVRTGPSPLATVIAEKQAEADADLEAAKEKVGPSPRAVADEERDEADAADPLSPIEEVRAQLPEPMRGGLNEQFISNAIDLVGMDGAVAYLNQKWEEEGGAIEEAALEVREEDLDPPDAGNAGAEGEEAKLPL